MITNLGNSKSTRSKKILFQTPCLKPINGDKYINVWLGPGPFITFLYEQNAY